MARGRSRPAGFSTCRAAVDLYRNRQYGLALTFAAYAVGNIGLLLAARRL